MQYLALYRYAYINANMHICHIHKDQNRWRGVSSDNTWSIPVLLLRRESVIKTVLVSKEKTSLWDIHSASLWIAQPLNEEIELWHGQLSLSIISTIYSLEPEVKSWVANFFWIFLITVKYFILIPRYHLHWHIKLVYKHIN